MNKHYISELNINNVRHIKKIDIKISDTKCKHIILTGKNGSGKTSVLEALAAYLSQFSRDIRSQKEIKVAIELRKYTERKLLRDDLSVYERKSIEQERDNYTEIINQYYKGVSPVINSFNEMQTMALEGNFIFAFYKDERRYSVPNVRNIEMIDFKQQYSMQDTPGKMFVKYLLNMKATAGMHSRNGDEKKVKSIDKWFENFDHIIQEVFDNQDVHLTFDIDRYEFKIEQSGRNPISFDQLSSGYAAIFEIITDIMMRMERVKNDLYDVEGIVIIDEIETHLHLSMQKKIMNILTKMFPNIQFVISTHSPFIINSISNVVVYDLERNIRIGEEQDLTNVPYSGIVDSYFDVSELSDTLTNMFKKYKLLAEQDNLSDDDWETIYNIEEYLDNTPDYLGLSFMPEYIHLKNKLMLKEPVIDG